MTFTISFFFFFSFSAARNGGFLVLDRTVECAITFCFSVAWNDDVLVWDQARLCFSFFLSSNFCLFALRRTHWCDFCVHAERSLYKTSLFWAPWFLRWYWSPLWDKGLRISKHLGVTRAEKVRVWTPICGFLFQGVPLFWYRIRKLDSPVTLFVRHHQNRNAMTAYERRMYIIVIMSTWLSLCPQNSNYVHMIVLMSFWLLRLTAH